MNQMVTLKIFLVHLYNSIQFKNNRQNDDTHKRSFIPTLKPLDIGETLDLIQYKCYIDILKQKGDIRAINTPLSYSKSIQYLGKETNMYLKVGESPKEFNEKFSNSKLYLQTLKNNYVQSSATSRNFDGTMPILRQRDYWSPVNSRVQKLIQKAIVRQQDQELQNQGNQLRNDIYEANITNGFPKERQVSSLYKTSYDDNLDNIREKSDMINQEYQTKASPTSNKNEKASFYSNKNLSQSENNQQIISQFINSNSTFSTPKNSKRENLTVKEQYALKSSEKIQQPDHQQKQKQFTPLKLNPPFVKKAYGEKSQTFSMGFLKNNVQDNNDKNQNIIHANDKLRSQWQSRVGNSQSKQSVQIYDSSEPNRWRVNNSPRNYSQTCRASHFEPEQNSIQSTEQDKQENSPNGNFQKLLEFVHSEGNEKLYKSQTKQQKQYVDEGVQKFEETTLSQSNLLNKTNCTNVMEYNKIQISNSNNNTLINQLMSDGFNHFQKSKILKRDIELMNQSRLRQQLGSQQSFKQQFFQTDAEMIIKNQMPGSKIMVKRVHQRNSSLNPKDSEINHKVYFTLPDRVNFFKSKNFGVSPNIQSNRNNQISIK